MKFQPGQIVATPGALEAFEASGESPLAFLQRHLAGDWGELSPEDIRENEFSLQHGWRLLSAYRLSTGVKVWVITEADRSVTTLLLPDELSLTKTLCTLIRMSFPQANREAQAVRGPA